MSLGSRKDPPVVTDLVILSSPAPKTEGEPLLGSLSTTSGRHLPNYFPLPSWSDDPTDPSIRDVEEETPIAISAPAFSRSSSYQPPRSPFAGTSPVASSPGAGGTGGSSSSPLNSSMPSGVKARFKDLDAFLDESSGDDDEEESSEEEDVGKPSLAVTKQPIFQEDSDEDSEEETDSDEESEDESSEEESGLMQSRR